MMIQACQLDLHPFMKLFLGQVAPLISCLQRLLSAQTVSIVKEREQDIPLRFIWVRVGLHVVFDIVRGRIVRGITRHTRLSGRLVDPNIIESHSRGEESGDTGEIDRRESRRHAKIHNQRHGLRRNHALTDIPVGANGPRVELPRRLPSHRPRNAAFRTRGVVIAVLGIGLAVIPVVVEIRQPRQCLLVRSTLVAVQIGYRAIIDLHEICKRVSD